MDGPQGPAVGPDRSPGRFPSLPYVGTGMATEGRAHRRQTEPLFRWAIDPVTSPHRDPQAPAAIPGGSPCHVIKGLRVPTSTKATRDPTHPAGSLKCMVFRSRCRLFVWDSRPHAGAWIETPHHPRSNPLPPTTAGLEPRADLNTLIRINGARGRNRTTDTRIFNPKLSMEDQAVTGEISVKPTTEDQALSGRLSNHLRARKGALGKWCGGVFRSVKRNDPSPPSGRCAPIPGARA
jgi:hypothetical protein